MKKLAIVTCMILVGGLSSCGLVQSDKRSLKIQVQNYQDHLSNSNWKSAIKMCHDDFDWIQNGKKYKGRRTPAAKAFHKSIDSIRNQDTVLIDIKRIKELRPGKYIITGFMQVRQAEAGTLRSVKWDVSMTWIKVKGGSWRILEINELSTRQNFAS